MCIHIFIKVFKTANSYEVRKRVGCPIQNDICNQADLGPSFRLAFEKDIEDLGAKMIYSSAYHPQSQGLFERSMRTLKDILNKNRNPSQLLLNEHIYAVNFNEDGEKGSAMSKYMSRTTRTAISNRWQ